MSATSVPERVGDYCSQHLRQTNKQKEVNCFAGGNDGLALIKPKPGGVARHFVYPDENSSVTADVAAEIGS